LERVSAALSVVRGWVLADQGSDLSKINS